MRSASSWLLAQHAMTTLIWNQYGMAFVQVTLLPAVKYLHDMCLLRNEARLLIAQ